jgi:ribonuclease-3
MKFKNRIKLVEETLGYEFRDKNIISRALTHSSCRRFSNKIKDNENLEYLGDAVLSMIITDILFREHPNQTEGGLTKLRSAITNNKILSESITKLGLQKTLRLGPGQKPNESILSDLFESLIGAIYVDGGFHSAFYVIKKVYDKHWEPIAQNNTDYKSQLQELTQSKLKTKPDYQIVSSSGPAHNKIFTIGVLINGKVEGIGKGNNKKQAEQLAAKEAFEKLSSI